MKRASVIVVALACALCMALALAGCSTTEYKPQAKVQTINDSALSTAGTLRVGVNASNAPYATESSGSIVGIDVDIAAAIADEMGLKLELVDVGTSTDNAFTKENVDIVMGVSKAGTAYKLTDAYMQSGVALFSLTQSAQAPTEAGSFSVAAQSSSMSALEVTELYGEASLVNSSDLQSAFESLNTGSANYVAADSVIGQYVAHSANIEAYPIALLQEPSSYCVAYASEDTELASAVQDALATVSAGGVIDVIEKRWLGGDMISIAGMEVVEAPVAEETTEESTNAEGTEEGATTDATTTDEAAATDEAA